MGRAERQRQRNAQPAAQVAVRQDRLAGQVDLGAGAGRMVAERRPGFGERGAAGRARQELDAELRLQAKQPPADDGLGDAEPPRGRRDPSRIRHGNECLQILDVHPAFPVARQSVPGCDAIAPAMGTASWRRKISAPEISSPKSVHPSGKEHAVTFRNGLDSLLRPEDSVVVLIDHQPYQLTNVNSHEPQMVVNNAAALAKAAKAFPRADDPDQRHRGSGRLHLPADHRRVSGPGGDRPHLHQHLGRTARSSTRSRRPAASS